MAPTSSGRRGWKSSCLRPHHLPPAPLVLAPCARSILPAAGRPFSDVHLRGHPVPTEMEGARGRGCWERPSRVGAPWGARAGGGTRMRVHVRARGDSSSPRGPLPAPGSPQDGPTSRPPTRFPRQRLTRSRAARGRGDPGRGEPSLPVSGPRAPPRGRPASCTRAAEAPAKPAVPLRPAASRPGPPRAGAGAAAMGTPGAGTHHLCPPTVLWASPDSRPSRMSWPP